MILTNCAACAAPLALDHKKRCSRCKTMHGIHHGGTLVAAGQLACTLIKLERYAEVKALTLPIIRKRPKECSVRIEYARALYQNEAASRDEVFEAGTILCEIAHRNPAGHGPIPPAYVGYPL